MTKAVMLFARAKKRVVSLATPHLPKFRKVFQTMTREEQIRAVAAGLATPPAVVATAIADGSSITAFTIKAGEIHQASQAAAAAAKAEQARHVAAANALVAGTVAYSSLRPIGIESGKAAPATSAATAEDQLAAEIAAFLPADRRRSKR